MSSKDFYESIKEKLNTLDLSEIKEFVYNLIRKIPDDKYDEVLAMLDLGNSYDVLDTQKKIEEFRGKFNKVDECEFHFYASGYEDYDSYDYWGDNWVWEYYDEDNLGSLIKNAYLYAINLVNKRLYNYAKQLLDLIIYTNYRAYDEDAGEFYELSLTDLSCHHLIQIDVDTLCLYAIYATYQMSEDSRVQRIHDYFQNEAFCNIHVEDSFSLGPEVLKGTDEFWQNWIMFLSNTPGKTEYRLLKEALVYNSYANYDDYIEAIACNHPQIVIDLLNYLYLQEKVRELLEAGRKVLKYIDDKLLIKSDILLYLARFDDSIRKKCIFEAFQSNSNVVNLLRIINNGYLNDYKEEINHFLKYDEKDNRLPFDDELEENHVTKDNYYYLQFFLGNFDVFYQECLQHNVSLGWSYSFIDTAVKLWLLLLMNKRSIIYDVLLNEVFFGLGVKDHIEFLDHEYYTIFNKWRSHFEVKQVLEVLNWLQRLTQARVDAIVSNQYRKSYFKAAELVVALGQALEDNDVMTSEKFINDYHMQYCKYRAFRTELNKYGKDID